VPGCPAQSVTPEDGPSHLQMADTSRLRALVIDDDRAVRALVADLLTVVLDVEIVDTASDGAAGLALFEPSHYDLVITDFLMPGLRGTEVAKIIRERDPGARVVMLTGSAADEEFRRAQAAGVTVLAKPIGVEEFRAAIDGVLSRSRMNRSRDTGA
jgi:CheY-like chemotaxis protein